MQTIVPFNLASPTRDTTRENRVWLRGYVGHSMRIATAPCVVMSTNVISVGKTHSCSIPVYLKSLLSTYDPDLKKFLIHGFSLGFRIGFAGTGKSLLAPNLRSAEEQPEVLSAKLDKEWSAGRILGPFSSPPFANFVSSPSGVVPVTLFVRRTQEM